MISQYPMPTVIRLAIGNRGSGDMKPSMNPQPTSDAVRTDLERIAARIHSRPND